jgi:Cof subfamily protein (haloacid dehalogenase superfamily)
VGKFTGVLLVTDLDGTLLDDSHQISPGNKAAIDRFIQQGGSFTLATGRSKLGIRTLLKSLQVNAPVILCNGAMLVDIHTDTILEARMLSDPGRLMAQTILDKYPKIGIEILTDKEKYCINRGLAIQAHFDFVQYWGIDIEKPSEAPGPWVKILVVDLPLILREVGDWLITDYGTKFEICFSNSTLLELQDFGLTKGLALDSLMKALNIPSERTYCCGDQQNDLTMLQAAHGWVPSNAIPECKGIAEGIGPDHSEDFIAFVIDRLDEIYH